MKKTKSVSRIIYDHIFTYFNFLNLVLFVLIIISGQIKNALFMGVVISNSLIGIIQELRVKKLIDDLKVLTTSKARVYDPSKDEDSMTSDDPTTEVPIEQVEIGNHIKLISGDQIPNDAIVVISLGLEVDESMLTGESVPVQKNKGDELFSGSFVVAGSAVARVIHVGDDNYAGKLAEKARTKKRASSEMQYAINKIIRYVSYAILPIGVTLFLRQFLRIKSGLSDSLVSTVAGVLGMIPEGLVLLTSISFILGVGRLAKKNAYVQEMEAIEALARVDILCLDKTGTITTGDLSVTDEVFFVEDEKKRKEIREIISCITHAFSETNITGNALKKYYKKNDLIPDETLPFNSRRKYMGITCKGTSYVLGAPEFITDDIEALKEADKYAQKGYRVLLMAKNKPAGDLNELCDTKPLMLVVLSDVVKEDAKPTLEFFKNNGVDIKIISGDNPATASSVAISLGLKDAEKYVDASLLDADDEGFYDEVSKYTVFGRVTPEMKNKLIIAFRSKGVVGMVGDGVNDVLALKEADCSIAMANGADAARQTAHIVLTDSDFSSMKGIVAEGRTIISNIERVSALYLTKTIYSILLCVVFILLGKSYPFIPIQLSLIGAMAIGIPSFILTLEQHEEPVISGFLKHVLKISLPGALLMVMAMVCLQFLSGVYGFSDVTLSTLNMFFGGFISLGVLFFVCTPITKKRLLMCICLTALFVMSCLLFPRFFGIMEFFA